MFFGTTSMPVVCHPARSSSRTAWAPRATSAGDLVEVELHGFGVGERQREGRTYAARWADRAKQIGALVALVGRLAGARSAARPLPHDPVLLTDAGLVLEPDLDGLARREIDQVGLQRGREVFLNSVTMRSS